MPAPPFLNTNLVLRHLTQDHADHSQRATALIRRIAAGELTVRTAETVVFETVYTLQRFYRVPRADISRDVMQLLSLPGIELRGKGRLRRTFDLYVTFLALSFADCYHVAVMESQGLNELLSFDQDFDRIHTIARKEPDSAGLIP